MRAFVRSAVMLTAVALLVGGTSGAGIAAPAQVKESFHVKKDPVTFRIEPNQACVLGTGTVTASETGVGHLSAAGFDAGDPEDPADDALIAPAKLDLNIASKVTFTPDDPSLPTYAGGSHWKFAWKVDEGGVGPARVERTIVLKAPDGSRYFLHHVGRAVFDLSQIDSPNEGIVQIVFDKINCGR